MDRDFSIQGFVAIIDKHTHHVLPRVPIEPFIKSQNCRVDLSGRRGLKQMETFVFHQFRTIETVIQVQVNHITVCVLQYLLRQQTKRPGFTTA